MSATATAARRPPVRRRGRGALIGAGVVVVLVAAMAFSTKVVPLGSKAAGGGGFQPAVYGAAEFPKVQSSIEAHAVDAAVLAAALAKDRAAALKQYGNDVGGASVVAVKFTGVVGKEDFGTYDVAVPGVPAAITIQVQTGPAIMGTALRDASPTIKFGQFKNQIEYQNAGSAINKEMKRDVLSKLDTSKLAGKTISVVGAFRASDSGTWLVTPVKLGVQ